MFDVSLLLILISLDKTWSSFSYAQFESPDSGSVQYSIKHNQHDFLQQDHYNTIGILDSQYDSDNEPSHKELIYGSVIGKGTIPRTDIWKNEGDQELIKELFRPGRLARRNCNEKPCPEQSILRNSMEDWRNQPGFLQQSRAKFMADNRNKIKFPDEKVHNSPRLGSRSKELGMSGRLRNTKTTSVDLNTTPEIKYITFETVSIVPPNNLFKPLY